MAHPFIEHLKKDHQKQRELGGRLCEAEDPEKRKKIWDDLCGTISTQ